MTNQLNSSKVQAAGAVLWRKNGADLEIALIHRMKYDDWSLPKGKVEKGESYIATAFREVLEETGYESVFGPEIGMVEYKIEGLPKEVHYWAAQATKKTGDPDPREVDQIIWQSPKKAKEKLTNRDDQKVINFFLDFGIDTVPIVLLRHAKALRRSDWDGDDGDRPLENVGQIQAKRLLSTYLPFGIQEIHTSDAMRCIETIDVIAKQLKLVAIYSTDLSEHGYSKDSKAPLDYVENLISRSIPTLICSHNPIIPKVVKRLVGKKYFKSMDIDLEPAQSIVLHCRDGEVIACDWLPEPSV